MRFEFGLNEKGQEIIPVPLCLQNIDALPYLLLAVYFSAFIIFFIAVADCRFTKKKLS